MKDSNIANLLLYKDEYDIPEVSKIWGISQQAILQRIESHYHGIKKTIPSMKRDRWFIPKNVVVEYLENHPFALDEYIKSNSAYILAHDIFSRYCHIEVNDSDFDFLSAEIKKIKRIYREQNYYDALSEYKNYYDSIDNDITKQIAFATMLNNSFSELQSDIVRYTNEILKSIYFIQKCSTILPKNDNSKSWSNADGYDAGIVEARLIDNEFNNISSIWRTMKNQFQSYQKIIDEETPELITHPDIMEINTVMESICSLTSSESNPEFYYQSTLKICILLSTLILVNERISSNGIVYSGNHYKYMSTQEPICNSFFLRLCYKQVALIYDRDQTLNVKTIKKSV